MTNKQEKIIINTLNEMMGYDIEITAFNKENKEKNKIKSKKMVYKEKSVK